MINHRQTNNEIFNEEGLTEVSRAFSKIGIFNVSFNLKIFIFLSILSLVSVFSFILLKTFSSSSDVSSEISNIFEYSVNTQTISTPFPFEEMTIPYLKARSYESSLSDLEIYETNNLYTSYLTSYDSDGFKVNGLLTVPNTEKPKDGYPAIVFVHGYIPPSIYKTENNYSSYVDYFARRGFIVLKIDLRGHDESEGEASGAYYSGDYVIDTLNAYSALQNKEDVNSKKIGLWGHSMAGNVVFRALAVNNSISKTVIWAGAVYTYDDFSEFGIDDNSYRPPDEDSERRRKRDELFDLYGRFDSSSWFWQQVPATNYLDGITTAIQVHHAIDDSVVSIDYSRNLMKVLDSSSVSHELFEYPIGGHNLTGSAFNQAMQRSVDFYLMD